MAKYAEPCVRTLEYRKYYDANFWITLIDRVSAQMITVTRFVLVRILLSWQDPGYQKRQDL